MRKIIEFFKKNSWIWIITIVMISIVGDAILTRKISITPSPTSTPQAATFKNIVPGVSGESDLNKVWGTPIRTTINNSQKTNEYSGFGFRNQTAIIENNKIVLIKEVISSSDSTKADSIISIYGQAPYTLYTKYSNYSFQLYVYPQNGIAYLGASDGTLSEIWYFQPTTIEIFSSKWAQDYQSFPPSEQLQ